jgi:hypothetical protein
MSSFFFFFWSWSRFNCVFFIFNQTLFYVLHPLVVI